MTCARHRTLLIADDEIGIRDLVRFALEPLGFDVAAAENGLEAIELVRDRPFDLVVLDVHMPKMGGREALLKVCELRPEQRVLIMTTRSDMDGSLERWALEAGALDCVFKPLELDELIDAIERTLARPTDSPVSDFAGGRPRGAV